MTFPDELQRAFAAFESGRPDEAEQLCRRLLDAPQPPGEVFFLLGLLANHSGRHAESLRSLERAAQTMPPSVRLWSALGGACRAVGDLPRAGEYFTRCLQLDPHCLAAILQLGDVCYDLHKMELAAPLFRRATEQDPHSLPAWTKLANSLRNLGELDAALAAYARALALAPNDPVLHANRGRTLLAAGRLAEGFREFQFRWEPLGLRHYPQPVWDGVPLPGKTLFVFAEQGLGDTLQFFRFLRLARQRVGRLVFECQPPLQSLLQASAIADHLLAAGETPPPFDAYVPLLHLPAIFQTTLETIPAAAPYLTSPVRMALPAAPAGNLRVGLAWAGNPAMRDDAIRSLPLESLAPVLTVPGVSFFSLQWKIPARDQASFRASPLVNLMETVHDFTDTAALVEHLDLVISADTAVAHLAGALGRPVWTLLPASPDWRWLLHRADTPWYPTMRLFRQPRLGAWPPVATAIAAELRQLAGRSA
jgi:tetratricopeptide (TPR) repeat protein